MARPPIRSRRRAWNARARAALRRAARSPAVAAHPSRRLADPEPWPSAESRSVRSVVGGPVARLEAGRADPIVAIYLAEHVGLFRFVRAATGDDEAAEDVRQETFFRLIREMAAGRRPANVHAWLFRVATNLVVSQARRARTAERHLAHLDPDPLVASPEQVILRFERDTALRAALSRLPVDARAALLLAAQGFTGREIASTLGRSEGAVRTLLCRSRRQVRQRLESDGPARLEASFRPAAR